MGGSLSFLAKWTCIHATGPSTGQYTFLAPEPAPYRGSFDRQNWMLGGSFSIPLASLL